VAVVTAGSLALSMTMAGQPVPSELSLSPRARTSPDLTASTQSKRPFRPLSPNVSHGTLLSPAPVGIALSTGGHKNAPSLSFPLRSSPCIPSPATHSPGAFPPMSPGTLSPVVSLPSPEAAGMFTATVPQLGTSRSAVVSVSSSPGLPLQPVTDLAKLARLPMLTQEAETEADGRMVHESKPQEGKPSQIEFGPTGDTNDEDANGAVGEPIEIASAGDIQSVGTLPPTPPTVVAAPRNRSGDGSDLALDSYTNAHKVTESRCQPAHDCLTRSKGSVVQSAIMGQSEREPSAVHARVGAAPPPSDEGAAAQSTRLAHELADTRGIDDADVASAETDHTKSPQSLKPKARKRRPLAKLALPSGEWFHAGSGGAEGGDTRAFWKQDALGGAASGASKHVGTTQNEEKGLGTLHSVISSASKEGPNNIRPMTLRSESDTGGTASTCHVPSSHRHEGVNTAHSEAGETSLASTPPVSLARTVPQRVPDTAVRACKSARGTVVLALPPPATAPSECTAAASPEGCPSTAAPSISLTLSPTASTPDAPSPLSLESPYSSPASTRSRAASDEPPERERPDNVCCGTKDDAALPSPLPLELPDLPADWTAPAEPQLMRPLPQTALSHGPLAEPPSKSATVQPCNTVKASESGVSSDQSPVSQEDVVPTASAPTVAAQTPVVPYDGDPASSHGTADDGRDALEAIPDQSMLAPPHCITAKAGCCSDAHVPCTGERGSGAEAGEAASTDADNSCAKRRAAATTTAEGVADSAEASQCQMGVRSVTGTTGAEAPRRESRAGSAPSSGVQAEPCTPAAGSRGLPAGSATIGQPPGADAAGGVAQLCRLAIRLPELTARLRALALSPVITPTAPRATPQEADKKADLAMAVPLPLPPSTPLPAGTARRPRCRPVARTTATTTADSAARSHAAAPRDAASTCDASNNCEGPPPYVSHGSELACAHSDAPASLLSATIPAISATVTQASADRLPFRAEYVTSNPVVSPPCSKASTPPGTNRACTPNLIDASGERTPLRVLQRQLDGVLAGAACSGPSTDGEAAKAAALAGLRVMERQVTSMLLEQSRPQPPAYHVHQQLGLLGRGLPASEDADSSRPPRSNPPPQRSSSPATSPVPPSGDCLTVVPPLASSLGARLRLALTPPYPPLSPHLPATTSAASFFEQPLAVTAVPLRPPAAGDSFSAHEAASPLGTVATPCMPSICAAPTASVRAPLHLAAPPAQAPLVMGSTANMLAGQDQIAALLARLRGRIPAQLAAAPQPAMEVMAAKKSSWRGGLPAGPSPAAAAQGLSHPPRQMRPVTTTAVRATLPALPVEPSPVIPHQAAELATAALSAALSGPSPPPQFAGAPLAREPPAAVAVPQAPVQRSLCPAAGATAGAGTSRARGHSTSVAPGARVPLTTDAPAPQRALRAHSRERAITSTAGAALRRPLSVARGRATSVQRRVVTKGDVEAAGGDRGRAGTGSGEWWTSYRALRSAVVQGGGRAAAR